MASRGNISGFAMIWLAVVAVGLFAAYLYWLKVPAEQGAESLSGSSDGGAAAGKRVLNPDEHQFDFDFFSLLPEQEYRGVEEKSGTESESTTKGEEKRSHSVSPGPSGDYLIQLGAFSRLENADRHKAKLLLMGVENVRIETVKTTKGVRYRVNVGPFQSYSSADHEQERLRREGYTSILKKSMSKSRKRQP